MITIWLRLFVLVRRRMLGIYNKYGERLYQFGSFEYKDDAYNVLRKAMEQYPLAGCRIKTISDEKERLCSQI